MFFFCARLWRTMWMCFRENNELVNDWLFALGDGRTDRHLQRWFLARKANNLAELNCDGKSSSKQCIPVFFFPQKGIYECYCMLHHSIGCHWWSTPDIDGTGNFFPTEKKMFQYQVTVKILLIYWNYKPCMFCFFSGKEIKSTIYIWHPLEWCNMQWHSFGGKNGHILPQLGFCIAI